MLNRWQQLRLLQRELARELQQLDQEHSELLEMSDGVTDNDVTALEEKIAGMLDPVHSKVSMVPPPCAFLRPGQSFGGRQHVSQMGVRKHETWGVNVTIQGYDPARGYVCGTMEASDVPGLFATSSVTTFFEGEVVDCVHHSFYTADWSACAQTDLRHWTKFDGFQPLHSEVVKSGGRSARLAHYPYVFMRWKERFFVKGSESRLTIAGFYYTCINRMTGAIEGLYYDPASTPDQKLELEAVTAGDAGHAFGHYDLA